MFTVGTGMCNVWAARYLSRTATGERRNIGFLGHGSVANGPPRAVGAPFTGRDRQVVSMSGDGGFSMPRGDFLPLVQYHLPVKVVLFINSALRMVELEMSVSGLPAHGAMYRDPGLAALARAAGAYGIRVAKPEQLTGALRDAFRHSGPAPVDGVTDPAALWVPPRIRAEAVTGFAWSTSKIVLDGGVGRMIRMARSNLRNVPLP